MGGPGEPARGRFVLRYQGEGAKPESDVASVRALADARIVDDSPRMLLVESDEAALRRVVDSLGDWVMAPDHSYPVPSTRREVKRPPS